MTRAERRPAKAEAGLTMIELLVTVAIIGIAFVVIVGGLSTAILGSDLQRRQASADTVLRDLADAIRDDDVAPYQDCASTYSIPPGTIPIGFTAAVPTVEAYWVADASTPPDAAKDHFATSCSVPDAGIQLLRISVTPDVRGTTQSVQIVKRRP